jgi:hypothetical protein
VLCKLLKVLADFQLVQDKNVDTKIEAIRSASTNQQRIFSDVQQNSHSKFHPVHEGTYPTKVFRLISGNGVDYIIPETCCCRKKSPLNDAIPVESKILTELTQDQLRGHMMTYHGKLCRRLLYSSSN